jgi:hypothetical protein
VLISRAEVADCAGDAKADRSGTDPLNLDHDVVSYYDLLCAVDDDCGAITGDVFDCAR